MPDQRIRELLSELAATAVEPRVKELIEELGTVLGLVASTEAQHAKDADQRLKTIAVIYRQLRSELRNLEQRIAERDHNVAAKIHQFAGHIMALENKLDEIADALNIATDIVPIPIDDTILNELFSDDDEQAAT